MRTQYKEQAYKHQSKRIILEHNETKFRYYNKCKKTIKKSDNAMFGRDATIQSMQRNVDKNK